MSASRRPAVIYMHFLEASKLAISGSERPAIIYAHFLKDQRNGYIRFWEACSYLCPLLRFWEACSHLRHADYLWPVCRDQRAGHICLWGLQIIYVHFLEVDKLRGQRVVNLDSQDPSTDNIVIDLMLSSVSMLHRSKV